MRDLDAKHIVLGLSGGIACYKAAELCRLLIQAGASVQVVMSEAAQHFITPTTMQALSQREVVLSQWDARAPNNMMHINLTREAHAMIVAPCSADFIAKLAHGRADDLLSLMCLARPLERLPLLLAPAMNREMWAHPTTQRNLQQVSRDGAQVLGVAAGEQACGESGDGRMLEPLSLYNELVSTFQPKVLAGHHVLITAGPTFEAIDPVRGLTNLSSGKMGFALAQAALQAGARVTLVAGPVALATPEGAVRVNVRSALEMQHAVRAHVDQASVFIATAAVADWRPALASPDKIKKTADGQTPGISFVENPDILAEVARCERAQSGALLCVGFAAESHDLERHAQEKRRRKGVPLLVGNIGPDTFGQDDNALLLVDAQGVQALPRASKLALSRQLVAKIAQLCSTEKP